MFSSPAPRATPRKSLYRPPGYASRAVTATPSLTPASERGDRREPATPRSRIVALRGASPGASSIGGESTRTLRHDDAVDQMYWARDERCAVSSLGALPREMQDVVRRSDLVTSRISGHVDVLSGYAFVATPTACVVWNYAKRTNASPTIYAFPAPQGGSSPVSATLHGTTDPGIILLSITGQIRFWDTLGAALSNVDRFHSLEVELGEDEYADRIWRIDSSSYLITTTLSRAFRLTVSSHAGRQIPHLTPITRSTGMFSRASPAIFSLQEDKEGVSGIAVDGANMWIMAGRTAQKWAITDSLKFIADQDLHDLVGNGMFADWATGAVDLTLCDVAPSGHGEYVVVVSYTQQESSSTAVSTTSYALALLGTAQRNGSLVMIRSISIGYQPTPEARHIDVARVNVQGTTALVRFSDVIVTVGLSPASPFEDIIALSDRNAFIGMGAVPHGSKKSGPGVVLMPLKGGMMGVDVYSPPIILERKSDMALATDRLKSKMEQAVFYGDRQDNPLTFDLFGETEADVAAAAEQVSEEIISATSTYMPSIFELRPLLSDRLIRLKQLVTYISRNNLLIKLPQSTRRRLSRDAEKAKGAIDLWDYQNKLMDHMRSHSPQSLLADSITILLQRSGVEQDDDRIRQFFRTEVQHVDQLLDVVFHSFRESSKGGDRAAWVVEANKIFITIMRAASQYREDELGLYAMDRENPSTELWTASTTLLDALEELYGTTVQLISERTRELGSAVDQPPTATDGAQLRHERQTQHLLKNQLTELAAAVCTNMEDKLRATSRRHVVEGADEQEGVVLKRKWDTLRPGVIRPLVEIDRVSHAYDLAEHHRDYETLVWLCHAPGISQDQKSKHGSGTGTARLQGYIERFGQEFAFVLYQWYIDQDQQHALLSQDEVYGGLVSRFFEQRSYPKLAWLHHVASGRYGAAARDLGDVLQVEEKLGHKSLLASIGKLAAVGEDRNRGSSDKNDALMQDFDNALFSVQVQNRLRDAISASTSRRSNQSPISTYIAAQTKLLDATGLSPRPAFKALFTRLVARLNEGGGGALDVEGLIDVLTMKMNEAEGEREDAAVALDVLSRTTTLPVGRRQVAAMSIWRRVFIRDDWAHIASTAGRSEDAQRRLLRGTSAYVTMQAVDDFDLPKSLVIDPISASEVPQLAELTARFPEYSVEEIEGLMGDHQFERERLLGYVNDWGLEDRVREVADLMRRDREVEVEVGEEGEEGGQDVAM